MAIVLDKLKFSSGEVKLPQLPFMSDKPFFGIYYDGTNFVIVLELITI